MSYLALLATMPPPSMHFRVEIQLALALPHKAAVLDGATQLAILRFLFPFAIFGRVVVGDHGVIFDFLRVASALFGVRAVLIGLVHNQDVKALAGELTVRTLVGRLYLGVTRPYMTPELLRALTTMVAKWAR